ncbi:hypothetical protein CONLIGDRAFT_82347 [Coniochaeta ligniaria NRRL 30616]|uniref:CST complex subunit Stn1 N-terminal domain-containing protein n=1 Tax=Coniochaeta ligniaria NRRL 30616 TaxID=1408157 RepID=A0A1J7ICH9_9PEZI|nr:hypothetical protein CONLIGDRAFT_82347 [Coniochaeta ligniaria NRRL 30616]
MTGESLNSIYPQYCFHLSPTIEKWCCFRARQIHGLTSHRGFEGQDLYFHLNHPIKWVQVAGVVVAIDEFYGRRIYTIDDSSGATIECVLNMPKQNANLAAISATAAEGSARGATVNGKTPTAAAQATTAQEDVKPVVDGEIDVGDILLVKGNITIFRNQKQIRVYKVFHLRSTEEEMQFWKKMTEFHDKILSAPWSLSDKEVRRCRRAATSSREAQPKERKRVKRKAGEAEGLESTSKPKAKFVAPAPDSGGSSKARVTGLERAAKLAGSVAAELGSRPDSRLAPPAPDEARHSRATMTGLERKTKRAEAVSAESSSIPKTIMITSTLDGGATSKTRFTGLERNATRVEAVASQMTGKPRTDLSPLASDRRARAKARATGLERSVKSVEATDTESTSTSETETVPPVSYRSSTRARATGLEKKPKRIKAIHVEGKYDALGI